MEDKYQRKEKNEDIRTEPHGANRTLQRPKNFSLQRRNDAYYFSDNSARGILKRVPFKYGSYRMNELQTVLEKSNSKKILNEIKSDVPLNRSGSSKAGKYSYFTNNDDSYESVHGEQIRDIIFKSTDVTARIKANSNGLKNLAILEEYEDYCRSFEFFNKLLKVVNPGQKEDISNKPFKGPEKKKQHSKVFVQTDSENLKGRISDEKSEKLPASNMSSSLKKLDESKDNLECLSERWIKSSLTAALSKISMKTPITEL